MKLRKYLEEMNDFVEKFPKALDLDVITSKDDEGNGFTLVTYTPTMGFFEFSEFYPADQFDPIEEDSNAVCLN